MTTLPLFAKGPCRIPVPGPARLTGYDAAGEPTTGRATVLIRPGGWFGCTEPIRQALIVQGLAVEAVPPDYLRPLLTAVLDATSPADAAERAFAAEIEVVTVGGGAGALARGASAGNRATVRGR